MTKKLLSMLLFVASLFAVPVSRAQTTLVSATVADPSGWPYSSGTVSAKILPPGVTSIRVGGKTFSTSLHAGLDLNGHFSLALADNNLATPAATQWSFTICGFAALQPIGTGNQCFTPPPITITGPSQDISAQLNIAAKVLVNVHPGAPTSGTNLGIAYSVITAFGATCNGTGVGDSAAFSTALNGVIVLGGGTVVLPPNCVITPPNPLPYPTHWVTILVSGPLTLGGTLKYGTLYRVIGNPLGALNSPNMFSNQEMSVPITTTNSGVSPIVNIYQANSGATLANIAFPNFTSAQAILVTGGAGGGSTFVELTNLYAYADAANVTGIPLTMSSCYQVITRFGGYGSAVAGTQPSILMTSHTNGDPTRMVTFQDTTLTNHGFKTTSGALEGGTPAEGITFRNVLYENGADAFWTWAPVANQVTRGVILEDVSVADQTPTIPLIEVGSASGANLGAVTVINPLGLSGGNPIVHSGTIVGLFLVSWGQGIVVGQTDAVVSSIDGQFTATAGLNFGKWTYLPSGHSSPYVLHTDEIGILDAGDNDTLTLLSPSLYPGKPIFIKRTSGTVGSTTTINTAAGTIDGSSSIVLREQNSYVILLSSASGYGWDIVGSSNSTNIKGSTAFLGKITHANTTDRTYTFPDKDFINGNFVVGTQDLPLSLADPTNDTLLPNAGGLNINWTTPLGLFDLVSTQYGYGAGVDNVGAFSVAYLSDVFYTSDQFSRATWGAFIHQGYPQRSGIAVRVQPSGDCYAYIWDGLAGAGHLHALVKFVGGVETVLADGGNDFHAGDVIEIRAVGTTISTYLNGVADLSIVDATISGGAPGLYGYGVYHDPSHTLSDTYLLNNWIGGSYPILNNAGGQLLSPSVSYSWALQNFPHGAQIPVTVVGSLPSSPDGVFMFVTNSTGTASPCVAGGSTLSLAVRVSAAWVCTKLGP